MTATPETKQFLESYTNERLPEMVMGSSETPGDEPSFVEDRRYVPLPDQKHLYQ
jgi:hypothetical protein